jgi:hypothetical protein
MLASIHSSARIASTLRYLVLLVACAVLCTSLVRAAGDVTPAEAHVIAKEAYIYGYPLVTNYRAMFAQAVERGGPQFLTGFNQLAHGTDEVARTTPLANLDVVHSFAWLDLRAEPIVLKLPAIEPDRFLSVQLVDLYTHNFAYLGTRTTGNGAGSFLIAGPGWKGARPPGIAQVLQAETQIVRVAVRTQLFNADDIAAARRIQAGMSMQPLSSSLRKPPAKAPAKLAFLAPTEDMLGSTAFFDYLAFVLRLCPVHPLEQEMRARFARAGLDSEKPFRAQALPAETRDAFAAGMRDAQAQLEAMRSRPIDPARMFGARERFAGDYGLRAVGAMAGLYGDSSEEVLSVMYLEDSRGEALDATQRDYRLHFGPGHLPPVNGFWSLTLYDASGQLPSANPLGRRAIRSRDLANLRQDTDGGVTIDLQADSPGTSRESNWLPAPEGPFLLSMRLYWPKQSAIAGEWKPPLVQRAQ